MELFDEGSFAGLNVVASLKTVSDIAITLIEKRAYFYNNMAAPRASVRAEFSPKTIFSYDKLFEGSNGTHKVVQDEVTAIAPGKVTLKSGADVEYDYLVIATGTRYGSPVKLDGVIAKDEAVNKLTEVAGLVKAAKSVLVIGGGPSGIEFAAETKVAFPDKEVTLLHSHATLISGDITEKFRKLIADKLVALGVKLVTGDRANLASLSSHVYVSGEQTVVTVDKEFQVKADFIIRCTGSGAPYTEFLPASLLNEKKFIKVKPTLQVDDAGFPNVFAIGDAANTGAPKKAYFTEGQAATVKANILAKIGGNPLKDYKAPPDNLAFLAFGPKKGYAEIPGMPYFITHFLARSIKAPEITNDKYAQKLGLPYEKTKWN